MCIRDSDRSVSHQHSDEVMEEALAVARHGMPAEGGRGVSTRTTRGERRERLICSICHGLVEKNDHAQVSCLCDAHRRCALGFCEDSIPRARWKDSQCRKKGRNENGAKPQAEG